MKFLILCALIAVASAAARGRGIELDLGSRDSSSLQAFAKQIAPLLLQRSSMLDYKMVPRSLANTAERPPIYAQVAGPRRAAAQVGQVQAIRAAAPVAIQKVQAVQAAPVQTVAVQPVQAQVQTVAVQPIATLQLVPVQAQQAVASATRASAQHSGPVVAAVQSRHHVEYVDVPSTGSVQPQSIIIPPSTLPLDIEFQSQSSPVSVRQTHIPGQPNPPQSSSHTDEPDVLRQEIVKPIIHEVTEAIQPIRKITQEVRPVEETVNQLIARGQQQQQTAVRAQSHQAQAVAVQAIPVQAVAVQAAPVQTVAVQAAPIEAALTETVASTIAVEAAPAVATSSQSLLLLQEGASASGGISGSTHGGHIETITVPVNARIIRFR